MKPVIVGIAGGSGSGKSTLTHLLCDMLGEVAVVCQDDYYLPHDTMPLSEREKINYDSPDALDSALLREHIRALKSGQGINTPVYDYALHTRTGVTRAVECAPVVIVEGMLVLADEGLRELCDLTVFVRVPEGERLSRRIARDVRERGRSEQGVKAQFERTVKPMHAAFVEPSAKYARVTVTGGGMNHEAAQALAIQIKQLTEKR